MPDKMFHKTNGNPPGPSGQPDELWGLAKASGVSRRRFLTLMAAGGAAAVIAACAGEAAPTTPSAPSAAEAVPVARVPLPPPDAKMVTTACDYCVVGCGYKVYTWPVGTAGGPAAGQNAMQVDFPVAQQTGNWVSPNMHNIVEISGAPHNVLVLPDWETEVVNVGGETTASGAAPWPRSSTARTSPLATVCSIPNSVSTENWRPSLGTTPSHWWPTPLLTSWTGMVSWPGA